MTSGSPDTEGPGQAGPRRQSGLVVAGTAVAVGGLGSDCSRLRGVFWGDESVLGLDSVRTTGYTKTHWTLYFKKVDLMAREFYLSF